MNEETPTMLDLSGLGKRFMEQHVTDAHNGCIFMVCTSIRSFVEADLMYPDRFRAWRMQDIVRHPIRFLYSVVGPDPYQKANEAIKKSGGNPLEACIVVYSESPLPPELAFPEMFEGKRVYQVLRQNPKLCF